MLARALIVLLVVLNLGVAVWWMARDDVAPTVPATQSTDVTRLQLLREIPRKSIADAPTVPLRPAATAQAVVPPATTVQVATAPAPQTSSTAEHCYAFGPFADVAGAETARAQLRPLVSRLHVRQATPPSKFDWRVWLPPLADRAAAKAMVARILAAGFDDYFIVAKGDEANSIALGRYASESSARQREAALHAGGFTAVRAQVLGTPAQAWVDVAVPATTTIPRQRGALAAAGVESVDCKTVP